MPLDESDREEIRDILAELLRDQLKDALGPVIRSQDEKFSQFERKIGETVSNSNDSWLDKLISEADSLSDSDDEDDEDLGFGDDDGGSEPEPTPRVDEAARRRLSEMEQAFGSLKTQYESEKKAREEAEARQRSEKMQSQALDAIQKSGIVRNPRQFFTVLQHDGIVQEQDGQWVVNSKDDYGVSTTVPLNQQIIENLVSTPDFAHFGEARPGTGTGAIPSSGNSSYSGRGKYFEGGNKLPSQAELAAIYKDPAKKDEMLKEFESLMK